jgi:hypothetical protein
MVWAAPDRARGRHRSGRGRGAGSLRRLALRGKEMVDLGDRRLACLFNAAEPHLSGLHRAALQRFQAASRWAGARRGAIAGARQRNPHRAPGVVRRVQANDAHQRQRVGPARRHAPQLSDTRWGTTCSITGTC